ncbi:MAG TPA: right-handed parallel beta-helix repeat-containing protein [Bacteroidales bacterium]|nr:right-handed parallel beta-helix repeat-containing protein [Bacteroidales bacterium]
MKLFYSCLIFVFCLQQLAAQTNIGGSVYSNTTLPLSGSPYIVTSNLTVENGATLTVNAGVELKFTSGKYLYVYGNIVANEATFTSNNATPAIGDWKFIQIGSTSHQGNATFDNCTFEYGEKIYVYSGEATITNSLIHKMLHHGIEAYGSVDMTNTTVNLLGGSSATNYRRGIMAMSGSQINVQSCNFLNCYDGFQIVGSITANDVSIDNCTGLGVYMNSGGSLTAGDLIISNCSESGILIPEGSTVNFTDTEIFACQWPVYFTGAGDLNISGFFNLHSNTTNAARVNFSSLSSNWILPDLNPIKPDNLSEYVPYYFYSDFTVNETAQLTITTDCIIKFAINTGLYIKGKISAQADVGEYIYFTSVRDDNWGGDTNNDGTSTSPAVNNWRGIIFNDESIDDECTMTRCQVRFGGYNNLGGINCYNASPTISDCIISNNYFGFYLKNASDPTITGNTIGSSVITPIAMSIEANPTFSNNVLSSSDNQYDAIGILGGDIVADAFLPVRTVTDIENITYLLLGVVRVPENLSLTVAPGVVIKSTTYDHFLLIDGEILMNGTSENPIVMTSVKDDMYGNPNDTNKDGSLTAPTVGDWGGMLMRETSSDQSVFNHCIFRYAEFYLIYENYTYLSYDGSLVLRNSSPTITNCQFGNVEHGITANFSSNPVISNCSFVNTSSTPIAMSLSANPVITGSTFTNTGLSGIGLLGEDVAFNGNLGKRDMAGYENISYVVLDNITINSGAYVNIEPGITIKFNAGKSITVNGGFKAEGTAGDKITFSSIHDDNLGNPADLNNNGNATIPAPGDWGVLKFTGTSDDDYCLLDHCNFRYGGSGMVYFENASGTMQNTIIESAATHGLICNGNAEPTLNDVIFQNCTAAPVGMSLLSNPVFEDITFTNNGYNGIRIIDNTLSSDATLDKRSIAGIDNVAYLIDQTLTIGQDAMLTINAGVVLKFVFQSSSWEKRQLIVNGAIKVLGTNEDPVYFTSDRDDSIGGDTNNDGNTTIPTKGDWYCIELNSSAISAENHFQYAIFRYGGYYDYSWNSYQSNHGNLRIRNSYALVENCTFEHSSTSGIGIFGNSNPEIIGNLFKNIELTPVTISMFSTPQFSGNTFTNVGIAALGIPIENWSVDATVPVRSFGGYNNITYFMYTYYPSYNFTKISNGTTVTIPEGIVFKFEDNSSCRNLEVNGRLICNGTADNPIVFTQIKDDAYGNPKDTNGDGSATSPSIVSDQSWIIFNDISNDESLLNHVIFRYQNDAVILNQASPTIKNCIFEHNHFGIRLNGVSAPVLENCTFHNLTYTPIRMSLVSYPSTTTGNIISGTTYKALGVVGETLNQEVSLQNRNFAGIDGIPYYFHDPYTIGTSGGMTIEPGVILKFGDQNSNLRFIVQNYLNAGGGEQPNEKIIFTDIRDDFYGGDTNADSTFTMPGFNGWSNNIYYYPWRGIYYENESFDELCLLDNCIVGYAGNYSPSSEYRGAINLSSASPAISNTFFHNNRKGIVAGGASNPVVNNCDFLGQPDFALENTNMAFTINAENCWWGHNSGPTHQGNPGGTGGSVTDGVNYLPFKTYGANFPLTGDPSLNGIIQAYDAALVLQHAVGLITLDAAQIIAADVSGNGAVTAYDASLILRYVIGFINYFPMWDRSPEPPAKNRSANLLVESATTKPGSAIKIPVWLNDPSNIHSTDIKLKFDTELLVFKGLKPAEGINILNHATDGNINIGLASPQVLSENLRLVILEFTVKPNIPNSKTTEIYVTQFNADEIDFTTLAQSGVITIIKNNDENEETAHSLSYSAGLNYYPNPFNNKLTIEYYVNEDNASVLLEVFDFNGKMIKRLADHKQSIGYHQVSWDATDEQGVQVRTGLYLIRLNVNNAYAVGKINYIR